MSFVKRFTAALVIAAAVLPFAAASVVDARHNTGNNNNNNSCGQNEFWYGKKSCCLPHGGVPNPPSPPKGSDCPPTGYYWGSKQGCCVPQHPPEDEDHEPQCRQHWRWNKNENKCHDEPATTTPPTPAPSAQPNGNNHGGNGGHHKRSNKSRAANLCPTGLEACPIAGLTGDFECLDTTYELESCGGCTTLGKGQDCTAIKGAWNVGCEQGSCQVYTCAAGFSHSANRKSCVAL